MVGVGKDFLKKYKFRIFLLKLCHALVSYEYPGKRTIYDSLFVDI